MIGKSARAIVAAVAAFVVILAPTRGAVAATSDEQERGEPAEGARSADAPFVHEGTLRNPVHGFQFPVPSGWTLNSPAAPDEMEFSSGACKECTMKILVSPGHDVPVEDTVRGIKQQIFKEADAVIVDEEVIRIAREKGYTLIREDLERESGDAKGAAKTPAAGERSAPPAEAKRVRTRYVTFNHGGDKYYLVLRAPRDRFASEDRLFEGLLEGLRFRP